MFCLPCSCSVSLILSFLLIFFFFFTLVARCFCKDCLDILVGSGTFDKLKDVDPWRCYFCKPSLCDGNLKLRSDWSTKVQDFFVNNSAMEFVSTTLALLQMHLAHKHTQFARACKCDALDRINF